MEIKIQIDKNLSEIDVIGALVSQENSDDIIGEIISYDSVSGIALCQLYDDKK